MDIVCDIFTQFNNCFDRTLVTRHYKECKLKKDACSVHGDKMAMNHLIFHLYICLHALCVCVLRNFNMNGR